MQMHDDAVWTYIKVFCFGDRVKLSRISNYGIATHLSGDSHLSALNPTPEAVPSPRCGAAFAQMVMVGLHLFSFVLGVASPSVRLVSQSVGRPAVAPKPPLSTQAPVPLVEEPVAVRSLQGRHLVQNPNVFQGISTNGQILEQPLPLGREEELELVSRAIFFIASTDAHRALTEAARDRAGDPDEAFYFSHEEVLTQMRVAASEAVVLAAAAQNKGQQSATEVPCEVPTSMSDVEFRLQQALGRAAYNKLFLHNRKVIYYEVNKVWPNWARATVVERADFLQEGAQGLLRAIRLFDASRGVRFSTYASWHVRAFVLRALRDKSHIVRLPQLLQADMQMIKKGRYRYAVENQGLMPSDSALAELLQWPLDRVEAALKGLASASATSLDAEPAGDHKGGDTQSGQSLHSRLPSEKHDSIAAENEVYRLQLRHTLRLAMSERDPRRIDILRLKYGLEDGVEWTYPQLAARFNTTANIAKGIVRTEMNFLRRAKKSVLQDFVGHLDYN